MAYFLSSTICNVPFLRSQCTTDWPPLVQISNIAVLKIIKRFSYVSINIAFLMCLNIEFFPTSMRSIVASSIHICKSQLRFSLPSQIMLHFLKVWKGHCVVSFSVQGWSINSIAFNFIWSSCSWKGQSSHLVVFLCGLFILDFLWSMVWCSLQLFYMQFICVLFNYLPYYWALTNFPVKTTSGPYPRSSLKLKF